MNIELYLGDILFAVITIIAVFCAAIMAKVLSKGDYWGGIRLLSGYWVVIGCLVFVLCVSFVLCFILFRIPIT